MPLKTLIENLESVPETLREFYVESDSGFVLDVDGIDEHPEVAQLRRAYTRVKASEKDTRAELKDLQSRADSLPDDFDADLWNKAKSGELEKGLVKVRKQLEGELESERARNADLTGKLNSMTVDVALAGALDAANITVPAYRKAATALLKDSVKLDGDDVVVESDMGPIDPVDFVKKWAASDDGKAFVTAPKGGNSREGDPKIRGGIKSWGDAKTPKEKVAFLKQSE